MAASRAREAGSIRHRLDTAFNDVTAMLIIEQRSSRESVGGRVRLIFPSGAEMSVARLAWGWKIFVTHVL
jgi:hypothetical protein